MPGKNLRLVWLFARTIDGLMAASPQRYSLSPVQFFALRFIALHDQPNLGAIAEALAVSNAAATKLVDRLVKKDLVARVEGAVDRRERRLTLTGKGMSILKAVTEMGDRRLDQILGSLSAADLEMLCRGIKAFLAAAFHGPKEIQRVCLRCGKQHERDCPGEDLYRSLGGGPRQV
ncbi:MAG: MarR family winged helix-turn-helix transcriptional regulator [Bacteroidota bacterium]